ncbi:SDR family oxidoreductase [Actinosynnema pretiosum]|uniref:3-beta hydroxysteroid dehydrogenase n=1 Tax=Actinosynnema pretiosum TaxID=42197 RepID=A0A290ZH13_9PSEU|nr:SDR family oxidoreductase [Actinosynnema pretiosum]ATE58273.1 3-beta hydroxysteroid dehydrogenase [Actinosynnema pretiosum]
MKIAVAGGTGTVGRKVVAAVESAGHEAVVLSPSRGVDLVTGEGLDAALAGCAGVIDVANTAVWDRESAERFFGTVATNLVEGCARHGVGHLVVLGIVGTDEVDLGYYYGKRLQERIVSEGRVPWTILRATQFFEFAEQNTARVEGDVVELMPMLSQPVATEDVAERLVELVTGEPRGRARPLAGQEKLTLAEMARRLFERTGDRREIRVQELGEVGAQLASGALTPSGEHDRGKRTFADYLAALEV